ncbi:MAG: translation initiation factor IF-3 [Candidatus Nealsonbacteria bacterium]|nr:translation initiation factor IF-3 [Candidatus Nealsonbacteria bacterium]
MKQPITNRQIRAREVRVVDETGKQLGLMKLEDAFLAAQERGLDLIQVTEKVEPPVCKIMDYGKYVYQEKKKDKTAMQKQKGGTLKGIRLRFNISQHDLETRASQTANFFKAGDKVRIEMVLRGREKALANFAKEKIEKFLEALDKLCKYKVERELKKEPKGFSMIISKG